jgi:DNA (cytosine-5)-methyltransferase 1
VKLGSLCSGYGGLELGIAQVLDVETAWVSDIDKGACKILAHRYPDMPNLGDITAVDWTTVEPVDVLCGGTPCQDLSHAGKRAGMTEGTRSNLWVAMREAIATLRPGLVVWENVGGAYSARADSEVEREPGLLGVGPDRPPLRALGRVLGDLASLGYDASWHGLRAADVGAPHGRSRVFVVASDAERSRLEGWRNHNALGALARGPRSDEAAQRCTTVAGDTAAAHADRARPGVVRWLQPVGRDADGCRDPHGYGPPAQPPTWGEYAEAICRWEALTRPAPPPTELGPKGNPRLAAAFSEWMMGLAAGWVTDVPGITRNEALRALGNGVVPQQAAEALRTMLAWEAAA